MVRGVASPAVDNVAVAEPVESVVGCVTCTPPESAENVTTTPEIRSFDEFLASTVMVAVAEPSDGIELTLDIAVSEAATTGGVVVPVPVPVPVPVVPVVPVVPEVPDSPVIDVRLPPHPAMSAAVRHITVTNLRIIIIP